MPLYDFVCATGHKFEELVKSDIKQAPCPLCRTAAVRQLACPHLDYLHMGLDPHGNPTAGDKWARMQEQKNRSQPAGQQ